MTLNRVCELCNMYAAVSATAELLFSLVSCVKPNGLLSAFEHAILC